jgi:hypothetical protein
VILAFNLTLAILLFLLPTFIALARKLPHSGYVAIANIAVGWTIAIWLGLVWYVVRAKSDHLHDFS